MKTLLVRRRSRNAHAKFQDHMNFESREDDFSSFCLKYTGVASILVMRPRHLIGQAVSEKLFKDNDHIHVHVYSHGEGANNPPETIFFYKHRYSINVAIK